MLKAKVQAAVASEGSPLVAQEQPAAAPAAAKDEGLRRIGCFMGGVLDDYRRRSRYLVSDWTDGFSRKTIPAALFMFFATFTSTVALGEHMNRESHGKLGVTEYLLMNSISGVAYAFFGCQPYVVLRPTGPITLLILEIYLIADSFSLDFYRLLANTGLWVGVLMLVIAGLELSRFITKLTRFSHDIFAFFVCTIYIGDGVVGVSHRLSDAASKGFKGDALLALNFALLVVILALWFNSVGSTVFFTRTLRDAIVSYALTLSVALVSALANIYTRSVDHADDQPDDNATGFDIMYITTPSPFGPTTERSWWVGLAPLGAELGVGFLAAVPIVIFFYLDQNISSLLTQTPDMNLAKGVYYHSSILMMGIFNVLGPLFGLPFVTGSLPHSPQFVLAMRDDSSAQSGSKKGAHVVETRLAALICYALIGASLAVPELIGMLPTATVEGTLCFVGFHGLQHTQLWERTILLFTEPALFPRPYASLGPKVVHGYTMVQLFCWAMCWVVNLTLGLAFPAWIVLLIPIRAYLLPNLFTEAQLEALDAEDEVASQLTEAQMNALMGSLSRARSKHEKWKGGA